MSDATSGPSDVSTRLDVDTRAAGESLQLAEDAWLRAVGVAREQDRLALAAHAASVVAEATAASLETGGAAGGCDRV